MIIFVRGLLEKMPLSSLTQRRVREKYRESFNKTTLDAEQCQLLRNVVLEVASSELSKDAKSKNTKKEATAAPVQVPHVSGSDQVSSKSNGTTAKRPSEPSSTSGSTSDPKKAKLSPAKAKSDEPQTIESDEDCVVVECRQADVLPHCRADCPTEIYKPTDNVKIGAYENNNKFCDKCFCYICDKKADQCLSWNATREPHCNANSKSPCWKARRMVHNQVKFQFINKSLNKHVPVQRQSIIKDVSNSL